MIGPLGWLIFNAKGALEVYHHLKNGIQCPVDDDHCAFTSWVIVCFKSCRPSDISMYICCFNYPWGKKSRFLIPGDLVALMCQQNDIYRCGFLFSPLLLILFAVCSGDLTCQNLIFGVSMSFCCVNKYSWINYMYGSPLLVTLFPLASSKLLTKYSRKIRRIKLLPYLEV